MTTTTTDVDVLNEWVQKIHFENRVDLNLQVPTAGESIKIEIDGIPAQLDEKTPSFSLFDSSPPQRQQQPADPYLSAILSSSSAATPPNKSSPGGCTGTNTCSCYKCQRQRRREMVQQRSNSANPAPNAVPPSPRAPESAKQNIAPSGPVRSSTVPDTAATKASNARSPPPHSSSKRSTSLRSKNSICKRKVPTAKSYEKHLPRPTYSAQDSIYRVRVHKPDEKDDDGAPLPTVHKHTPASQQQQQQQQQQQEEGNEDYQISWRDDATGDDLLNSIKTFHDIFATTPADNPSGLSDLLETRAHQLKQERTKQQAASADENRPEEPARIHGCYTMSHRKGGPHRALTLYHTMRMKDSGQRMAAYGTAFDHCVRANSGLSVWIQKSTSRGPPAILKAYTPRQRKPAKKSILQPLLPSKRNKGAEDMWAKITSESAKCANTTPYSTPVSSDATATPTDLISAAHNLLPHQSPNALLHDSLSRANVNTTPYDHVDTPSRPIQHSRSYPEKMENERLRDTGSISSTSTDSDKRSVKLFSSLGRRSLRSRRGTTASSQSTPDGGFKGYASISRSSSKRAPTVHEPPHQQQPVVMQEQPPPQHQQPATSQQKQLDDLCAVMPYHDRQVLASYLAEAEGDYLKALTLCKQAVVAGRL